MNIIRRRMQEIIDARMPIRRFTVPTEEAAFLRRDHFSSGGGAKLSNLRNADGMYWERIRPP